MLAFADAALIDSRLTVAKHSRVERILRELDPDDVLWLDVLEKVVGVRRGTATFPHQDALRWSVWNDCPASDILVASACVRTRRTGTVQSLPTKGVWSYTCCGCMSVREHRRLRFPVERDAPMTGPQRKLGELLMRFRRSAVLRSARAQRFDQCTTRRRSTIGTAPFRFKAQEQLSGSWTPPPTSSRSARTKRQPITRPLSRPCRTLGSRSGTLAVIRPRGPQPCTGRTTCFGGLPTR
jgi:hypothetical protein